MSNPEDPLGPPLVDLRVGDKERLSAQAALREHREAGRLDTAGYEQRWSEAEAAVTQSDLERIFGDLPRPHPKLARPPGAEPPTDDGSGPTAAVTIALVLGIPVAIVVGIANGAWWALSLPVGFSVAVLTIEHYVNRRRDR